MKISCSIVSLIAGLSTLLGCSSGPSEGTGSQAARVSAADCASAPAWAENVSYAAGALVSYAGTIYQCTQAHTSEPGWTPSAVPALWTPAGCAAGGGSSGSSGGATSGGGGSTGSSAGSCSAWVYMSSATSCDGLVGSACGWTTSNEGQGYTCQNMGTWTGCEPGGAACTAGSSGGGSPVTGGGSSSGAGGTGGGSSSCVAWVYMSTTTSCDGHLGSSCGWTTGDEGQGYHCADMGTWTGCEPGGAACTAGGGSSSGGGTTPPSGGATGGTGLAGVLSEATFDSMFPTRLAVFSYAGLTQAASAYPAFATTGDANARKREVAAFLANVAHETIDLAYVDEIVKGDYCSPSGGCPCAAGQQYYGRGAMQLSWNYNYCAAGAALGANLQANPGQVSTDSRLAWETGVWFWMADSGAGSQTPHDAIASSGFGATIQAINGSIECNGGNPTEVQDRVQYYLKFCAMLGVDPGSNTGC